MHREIFQHPVLRQVRAMLTGPMLSAPWGYETRKGVSKSRLKFVREMIEAVRFEVMADAVRAIDFGFAPFEKVWDIRGGKYTLARLKPLRVDDTSILHTNGTFAGLRYGGEMATGFTPDKATEQQWLPLNKSFLWTFDSESGDLYGRSMLENVRATAWRDWLDAATDLQNLSEKVSGIMPVLSTPPGGFTTADGKTFTYAQMAAAILPQAKRGAAIHITTLGVMNPTAGATNFDQLIALQKTPSVKLDVIDFGSNAPAIASLLERMRHDEELMFAGYLRSPRTGMATQGGTRADSDGHEDTATINTEVVMEDFARCFNRGVVDEILELNFGPAARGSIWVTPGKLTDANLATRVAALKTLFASPDLGTSAMMQVDWTPIFAQLGIPTLPEEVKLEAVAGDTGADDAEGGSAPDPNADPNGGDANAPGESPDLSAMSGAELQAHAEQARRRQGGKTALSREGEGDGHWVTIDGTHVHIGSGGTIDKGPSDMVGKSARVVTGHADAPPATPAKAHAKASAKAASEPAAPADPAAVARGVKAYESIRDAVRTLNVAQIRARFDAEVAPLGKEALRAVADHLGYPFKGSARKIAADLRDTLDGLKVSSISVDSVHGLSRGDDGGGHWVTINGEPVHINGDGAVDKGPKAMTGKGGKVEFGPAHLVGKHSSHAAITKGVEKTDVDAHIEGRIRAKHDAAKAEARANAAAAGGAVRPFGGEVKVLNDGDEGAVVTAAKAGGLKVANARELVGIAIPHEGIFTAATISTTQLRDGGGTLTVINSRASHGGFLSRAILAKRGKLTLMNGVLELPANMRGGGAGTAFFAGQVAAARAAGISAIKCSAAKGENTNGYYTWARLGYDGTIKPATRAALPDGLKGATKVSQLMTSQAGRDWWKANGHGFEASFKVTPDGSSQNERVLKAYVAERAGKSAGA